MSKDTKKHHFENPSFQPDHSDHFTALNNGIAANESNTSDQLRVFANVGFMAQRFKDLMAYRRPERDLSKVGTFSGIDPHPEHETDHLETTLKTATLGPDGIAFDPDQHMRDALNHSLLQYVARVSKPENQDDWMDLNFIYSLCDKGADINTRDKYGLTVLHEVARAWDVDVARFLVEVLNADVDKADNYGYTPLHVAASANFPEMINFLIEHGADKEALTYEELQTPLFYAAKNDAEGSLQALMKAGCQFKEVVDYRKRTPLYVAAELDRSATARILLEHNARADIRDEINQPCLVPLIAKMPAVAKDALDQFHVKERSKRMQYFYLSSFSATTLDELGLSKYPSVLGTIVQLQNHELIMHPVIEELLNVMWRSFGRWYTIGNSFIHLAYILTWSIFSVDRDWTTKHQYQPYNENWWRILIFIIAIIFTVYLIIDELIEYKTSKDKSKALRDETKRQIDRDIQFCHPRWPGETLYYMEEKDKIAEGDSFYFGDLWNIFDWMTYILLVICIGTHLGDIFNHNLYLARIHIRLMAIAVFFLWLRLMKIARAITFFGPLIVILYDMIGDVFRFMFIYLQFYIPFAFAFWLLIGGRDNVFEDNVTRQTFGSNLAPGLRNNSVEGFETIEDMLFNMFRLTLVDSYEYNSMIKIDHIAIQILLGLWFAISSILLINLFIALLSNSFQRVYDNARAAAQMQKAIIMLDFMNRLTMWMKKRYMRTLVETCDPETRYYDDDSGEYGAEQIKRATLQARNDISELKEKWDKYFGDSDDEGVSPLQEGRGTEEEKVRSAREETVQRKTSKQGTFHKNIVRNFATATKDQVSGEIEALKDQMQELKMHQVRMDDRARRDSQQIKGILQDIASVLTSTTASASARPVSMGIGGEASVARTAPTYPPGVITVEPAIEIDDYSAQDPRAQMYQFHHPGTGSNNA